MQFLTAAFLFLDYLLQDETPCRKQINAKCNHVLMTELDNK